MYQPRGVDGAAGGTTTSSSLSLNGWRETCLLKPSERAPSTPEQGNFAGTEKMDRWRSLLKGKFGILMLLGPAAFITPL